MAQFDDAKVGDKVWDVRWGWGKIKCRTGLRFDVLFNNGQRFSFWVDGKYSTEDASPTLFWDEVKIVAPEKPHKHNFNIAVRLADERWFECKCGARLMPKEEEKCEACELMVQMGSKSMQVIAQYVINHTQHHTCEKGEK